MNKTSITESNERRIAAKLINDALNKGYKVCLYDGEETTVWKSSKVSEVMKASRTTDADMLSFYDRKEYLGFVALIYNNGNEGLDLIADYSGTDIMDDLLSGVYKLIATMDL